MGAFLLNSLIILTFITGVKAIIFKSTDKLIDVVRVEHISSSHGHRHRRSADGDLPMEMHFRFSSKGSDVNLRLKRSLVNQPSDITVYVIRENGVVKADLPPIQNVASYLDKNIGASVLVRSRKDGNYTLEGIYYDSGGRVQIQPRDRMVHVISRAAEVTYGNDFIISSESSPRVAPGRASVRTKRQSVNEYTIGILMCADYKDYLQWENHYKNQTLVKNGMRQYYSVVAQSISLRYASVTDVDPRLKINIQITGLLLVDSPGKSYWTESETRDRETVEVKPALRSFKEWVRSQNSLPPSDHWMLFTGYDLTSGGNRIVAGLATLAAMCTMSSVSIIEQDFSASVGATAAHELGHCLSAVHDGSSLASSCPDSDNYIMSSKLVNPTENATASRPWEFSKCSVRSFRRYLARVYCAREPDKGASSFNTSVVEKLKPGQVYSSDIQCKLALGNESYFGRGIQYDRGFDTMCRGMYCAIPGRPRFFQKMFAMEKTTCGDGKWCVKGRCLSDPEAPRTPEFCPQGDLDDDCKLNDCPFLTLKGKISYCCQTCGVVPTVNIHTLPADSKPTTPSPSGPNRRQIYISQDPSPPQVNDKPSKSPLPDSTNNQNPRIEDQISIFGKPGSDVFAIVRGLFSRFRNMFGGSDNGNVSNTVTIRTNVNRSDFVVPGSSPDSLGSLMSKIFGNPDSGTGSTNVKFVSLGPRPLPPGTGGLRSIFSDPSGFSWSDSASQSRGGFAGQSGDPVIRDAQSFFDWLSNPRPFSTSISNNVRSVNFNDRPFYRTPPRVAVPRFLTNSRTAPRWRSSSPQTATSSGVWGSSRMPGSSSSSSSSRSRFGTITVSNTGNSRTFCVSCSPSWSTNSGDITRPRIIQTISSRPNLETGISWLRRSAIRSVAGNNANSDSFRTIDTLPRLFRTQG